MWPQFTFSISITLIQLICISTLNLHNNWVSFCCPCLTVGSTQKSSQKVLLKYESDFTPIHSSPQLSLHVAQSLIDFKEVHSPSSLLHESVLNSYHSPAWPLNSSHTDLLAVPSTQGASCHLRTSAFAAHSTYNSFSFQKSTVLIPYFLHISDQISYY